VLQRLSELLAHLKPGYREHTEVRTKPRGQIQWPSYVAHQMATGRWHHLPCRFSELGADSRLRQAVRWTLERLRNDLASAGGSDTMALTLAAFALRLLDEVADVPACRPRRGELERNLGAGPLATAVLREGLRAIGWIVDERGLGGGRSSDGLAWALPLEQLWERYVEKVTRDEAACSGGRVRVGRLGETTVPLLWNDRSHRALGHLVPDVVMKTPHGVEIVDAKYKAHFADLDSAGWNAFTDDVKSNLRADVHQILAYAATCGDAQSVTATLVYPVSTALYDELTLRSQDVVSATIPIGCRSMQLRLRALPFARSI
jgi:5-methylcytosine-specific restriction endonuclease McrBC regulatory subunit McrC